MSATHPGTIKRIRSFKSAGCWCPNKRKHYGKWRKQAAINEGDA